LALVTVTSALGRSSLYNRLLLREGGTQDKKGRVLVELEKIGETKGFGHFQVSDELFERIRAMLIAEGHPYANGHQYGDGPNWKLRMVRVGLTRLGLDDELTRHGIAREAYAMTMAATTKDFLCGRVDDPKIERPTVAEIGRAAVARWVAPRADRQGEWKKFSRDDVPRLLGVEQPVVNCLPGCLS
jgi:hypothetical protein